MNNRLLQPARVRAESFASRARSRTGAMLSALVLAAPAAWAAGDDEADAPAGTTYCSTTATTLFNACGHEVSGDFLVAKAKCVNIGDARLRRQCLADAKTARTEASTLCAAQRDGRIATCNLLGEARYDPPFDPAGFDSDFRNLSNPNPYFPLGIGYKWEFRGGTETTAIEVTTETKLIEGVQCIVLRDLVYESGLLKEATDDWFAAGRDGSTWYCGEEAKDYENFSTDQPVRPELVSIDGTFKHGRNGDKAGIIMPASASLSVGRVHREEFSLGNAEDIAEVLSVNYGYGTRPDLDRLVPRELAQRLCQGNCVVTKNSALLEPGAIAIKYYARGIGFFLEIKPDLGSVLQLTNCSFDARCVALPQP